MSSAHRGRRREWQVRDIFEAAGYTVIRAAASKGPCDLVALKREAWDVRVVAISVKSGNAWPGPAERKRMGKEIPDGCHRLIVRWPLRGRPSIREVNSKGVMEVPIAGWLPSAFAEVEPA